MRKLLIATLAVSALGMAACSENAQQETAEAGNAIAQDAENAGDAIATGAENAADSAAQVATDAGNVVEGTVNAAGDAAAKAGDKIEAETEKAKAND